MKRKVFATLLMIASIGIGQTAVRPAFDAASVKLSKRPREAGGTGVNQQGINYVGASLRMILSEAYNVKWPSMSSPDARIRAMLDEGTYDIVAKADRPVSKEQLMLMLQTLLADRFKLALHLESKVEPVYRLIVGKDGPKLQESVGDGELNVSGVPDGAGLNCRNITMSDLSRYLTSRMGRVVLDQTGLKGHYDFILRVGGLPTLEEARAAVSSTASPDATKVAMVAILNDWSTSSIFADIQKQLGLKLESDKAPVDNLVIDHVEKPSEN